MTTWGNSCCTKGVLVVGQEVTFDVSTINNCLPMVVGGIRRIDCVVTLNVAGGVWLIVKFGCNRNHDTSEPPDWLAVGFVEASFILRNLVRIASVRMVFFSILARRKDSGRVIGSLSSS
jgi:hypothetical protein